MDRPVAPFCVYLTFYNLVAISPKRNENLEIVKRKGIVGTGGQEDEHVSRFSNRSRRPSGSTDFRPSVKSRRTKLRPTVGRHDANAARTRDLHDSRTGVAVPLELGRRLERVKLSRITDVDSARGAQQHPTGDNGIFLCLPHRARKYLGFVSLFYPQEAGRRGYAKSPSAGENIVST